MGVKRNNKDTNIFFLLLLNKDTNIKLKNFKNVTNQEFKKITAPFAHNNI